jgi:hypothetical protein
MIRKWALILALSCAPLASGTAQEKNKEAPPEKDYVRIEIRGVLKVEGAFIRVIATPTNFTDEQT